MLGDGLCSLRTVSPELGTRAREVEEKGGGRGAARADPVEKNLNRRRKRTRNKL